MTENIYTGYWKHENTSGRRVNGVTAFILAAVFAGVSIYSFTQAMYLATACIMGFALIMCLLGTFLLRQKFTEIDFGQRKYRVGIKYFGYRKGLWQTMEGIDLIYVKEFSHFQGVRMGPPGAPSIGGRMVNMHAAFLVNRSSKKQTLILSDKDKTFTEDLARRLAERLKLPVEIR